MVGGPKKLSNLYTLAILGCTLLLCSCENSLEDIKKVSSDDANKPISRSIDVDVIYSDSALVKAHMTSPLSIDVTDEKKPYTEMPKGVKIIFYNDDLTVKGTITSDYAIRYADAIVFRKNVVAVNAEGEKFKSEELIDSTNAKKYYSSKAVQITMTNGDVVEGTGFKSNDSLYPWHIEHTTGIFHVTQKDGDPVP